MSQWQVKGEWREKLPPWMIQEFELYVNKHTSTSCFVRCLLENDLKGAFGQADETNRKKMFTFVSFLYSEMPTGFYGSREKVALWLGEITPIEIVQKTVAYWLSEESDGLGDKLLRILRENEKD
jgi:hypothetical protein